MRFIDIKQERPIPLGRKGENQVTTIRFCKRALFPFLTSGAQYLLVHQRKDDTAPYSCVFTDDGECLLWVIGEADVDRVGNGVAQLTVMVGDVVAKSYIFTTMTSDSLGETVDPPAAYQARVDQTAWLATPSALSPATRSGQMRYVDIKQERPIPIGKKGENQVTTIRFFKRALFPFLTSGAQYLLVHQRKDDAAPYPCVLTEDGECLLWVVAAADVDRIGNGVAQLTAMADDAVAKSSIFTTITTDSLGETTDPPAAYQAWVDQVGGMANRAENAAENAEAAQSAIENMTVSSETLEPDSEATVEKTVVGGVVNLEFGIPRGATGTTYTHEQAVASDTWTITHNLGKYPSVTVVDSGGTVVIGDVQYIDVNTIVITFVGVFSGAAYLN